MQEVQIWKPVSYNQQIWGVASTAAFDRIAPSWVEYRSKLNAEHGEYAKFVQKLKYEHSVETGIIERLYDVDEEGVTVTLLKDGINSNFLQHDNVENSEKVYALIRDQYEAIDGVFSFIKNERALTTSFIKELHSVTTRSQEFTEAVTPMGEVIKVPLLRGEYKRQDNNPLRRDGTVFMYCPPLHVSAEMDNLIKIYNQLVLDGVHVIIRAAFFHHALSTIHPFQDGNGRVTRLLTCLILIRDGYFPFSVKRNDRNAYLDALEQADAGKVQPFVDFIGSCQVKAIESALSLKKVEYENLDSVIEALRDKLTDKNANKKELIEGGFYKVYGILQTHTSHMLNVLGNKVSFSISLSYGGNSEENPEWNTTRQMALYASKFEYATKPSQHDRHLRLGFSIKGQNFAIALFCHHFGKTDDVLAIGGVLETAIESSGNNFNIIPLEVPPLIISLLAYINETTINDIKAHVERLILVGMAGVVAEV